jgi:hypothetical protein
LTAAIANSLQRKKHTANILKAMAANAILNASIMGMPPSLFSVMVKNLLHEFEEMLEDMLKHRYGPALKPHLLCY